MTGISSQSNGARTVTVIGAGNIGICCAIYLQRQGFNVTVIDRNPPGHGCSSGSAGVLSAWSCIPDSAPGIASSVPGWLMDPNGPLAIRWRYLPKLVPWLMKFAKAGRAGGFTGKSDALFRLNNPTVDLYKELLNSAGAPELIKDSSYLFAYRSHNAVDPKSLAFRIRREKGAKMDFLTGGEVQDSEPEISPAYCRAVAIHNQGHTVNPTRLVSKLAGYFERLGGVILRDEVGRIAANPDGSVTVSCATQRHESAFLIIAAGAWSHHLTAMVGCKLPLETERGYHMNFTDPGISIRHTILEGHRQFVTTEMEMGIRSAGTVEFAGLDAPPNPKRAAMLAKIAKQLLPNLNTSGGSDWMGHRSVLPDSLPAIGPLPGYRNIIAAFGHGHTGLTAAPMTAKLIARFLEDPNSEHALTPYLPERLC